MWHFYLFFLLLHASFNEPLNFTSGTGTFKKFVTFHRRVCSGQWRQSRSRASMVGSVGTRLLLHSGAAGEETPPTPAVAKRGVNSCSWKVKSSIARLSARSERGTQTEGMDGSVERWRGMKSMREAGKRMETIRTDTVTKVEKRVVCLSQFCMMSNTAVKTMLHREKERHKRRI